MVSTIDVATFVGPIKERVKAATGRELTVRGDTRFSLSLTPRLVLSDVALANAPWGQAKEMLAASRLELEVALLPLLSRRFELTEVDHRRSGHRAGTRCARAGELGDGSGAQGPPGRSRRNRPGYGLRCRQRFGDQRHADLSRWRQRQGYERVDRADVPARARRPGTDRDAVPRHDRRRAGVGGGHAGAAGAAAGAALALPGEPQGRGRRAESVGKFEHARRAGELRLRGPRAGARRRCDLRLAEPSRLAGRDRNWCSH